MAATRRAPATKKRIGTPTTAASGLVLVTLLVVGLLAGRVLLVPAAVTGGQLAAATCDGSWSMYQHDTDHSGAACSTISPLTVATLHPAWLTSTPGAVTAEPTVAGGAVYVGDSTGVFYALSQATGAILWKFDITDNVCHDDQHSPSYGEITSSAAYVDDAGLPYPMVFFGGGGSVFALDADSGACVWAQDADPSNPKSSVEVESSPVYDAATNTVIVGSDANESDSGVLTGVQAFDAGTGVLQWKFEPQTEQTVDTLAAGPVADDTCGDVWSSPALDASAGPSTTGGQPDGLVFFGVGNCDHHAAQTLGDPPVVTEATWAVDATTGALVWVTPEPATQYENPQTGTAAIADDDFGASVIVDDALGLVIQAGKSGYVYGLNEATGAQQWATQASQPGNFGVGPGAIGGTIGSPALGQVDGQDAVFVTSAIPAPLSGPGLSSPALDTTLLGDPARLASLHAINAKTGALLWHAVISTPTYSAVTYSDGVVFAADTTTFSADAYDADTGLPLWRLPLGAAAASGTSVVGSSVFVGSGIAEGQAGSTTVPPGNNGVWSFTTGTAVPTLNNLPTP